MKLIMPGPDDPSAAVQPVLGTTTALWLLALVILQVSLPQPDSQSVVRFAIWLGSMWGGLSVAIWMLASGRQSLSILGLLMVVTAWHIGWMHHNTSQPLARYVLSMGGLVVLQTLAMLTLGSPRWQPKPATKAASGGMASPHEPASTQFGISGLLVLTLLCAFCFAAVRVYETDDKLFYPGIAVAVCTLVTISLFAQRLISRPRRTLLWGICLLASLVGGVYALSTLASVNDVIRNQPASVAYIKRTDVILGTFACVVITTMLCGRIDAELVRQREGE